MINPRRYRSGNMYERKINLVLLWTSYDGNVTSVNDLIIRLDKNRFNPIFIFLTGNKSAENHLQQAGYQVFYLSDKEHIGTFNLSVILKLAKLLKESHIDILHCHAHKATVYGTLAAMLVKTPVVFAHVHGLKRSRTIGRKLINLLLYRKIDMLIPVADAVRDDILKCNWFVNPEKVQTLENSIDYERFANIEITKEDARQKLKMPPASLMFGTVGRLSENKGQTYLIRAFAKVKQAVPNSRLLITGDGPLRQKLMDEAIEMKIKDSVDFLGRRSDIELVFKAMDIFVLPSIGSEGMPRVLLEAMASGVPCVVTTIGGSPEVINSLDTGIIVPAKDSDSLAGAMKTIASMPAEGLEKLVKNAQNRIREVYSHEVVAEKLENLYETEFRKYFNR